MLVVVEEFERIDFEMIVSLEKMLWQIQFLRNYNFSYDENKFDLDLGRKIILKI
jgi:hypothetical protein